MKAEVEDYIKVKERVQWCLIKVWCKSKPKSAWLSIIFKL